MLTCKTFPGLFSMYLETSRSTIQQLQEWQQRWIRDSSGYLCDLPFLFLISNWDLEVTKVSSCRRATTQLPLNDIKARDIQASTHSCLGYQERSISELIKILPQLCRRRCQDFKRIPGGRTEDSPTGRRFTGEARIPLCQRRSSSIFSFPSQVAGRRSPATLSPLSRRSLPGLGAEPNPLLGFLERLSTY